MFKTLVSSFSKGEWIAFGFGFLVIFLLALFEAPITRPPSREAAFTFLVMGCGCLAATQFAFQKGDWQLKALMFIIANNIGLAVHIFTLSP